jgi:hypothetical protein
MLTVGGIGLRPRNGGQEPLGVRLLRVGKHLVAIALFHDLPPVHHRYPVGQVLDHRKIV